MLKTTSVVHLKSGVNIFACSKALLLKQHGFVPALKAGKHLDVLGLIHFYVEETGLVVQGDRLRQILMRNEGIRKELS